MKFLHISDLHFHQSNRGRGLRDQVLLFVFSSKPMMVSKRGADSVKMRFNFQSCLQLFL